MTDETKTNNTENNTNNSVKPGLFSRAIGWVAARKGAIVTFAAGVGVGIGATLGIQKLRQGQEEEVVVIDDGSEDQYPLQ